MYYYLSFWCIYSYYIILIHTSIYDDNSKAKHVTSDILESYELREEGTVTQSEVSLGQGFQAGVLGSVGEGSCSQNEGKIIVELRIQCD